VKSEILRSIRKVKVTDEYFELDLPAAPAVMVGDEIVVEGSDVAQYEIEAAICRQLNLPLPEKKEKGFLKKIFGD
jgi:hypothetical protein